MLEVIGEPASASLKKENNQWFMATETYTDLKIKVENKIKKSVLTDGKRVCR